MPFGDISCSPIHPARLASVIPNREGRRTLLRASSPISTPSLRGAPLLISVPVHEWDFVAVSSFQDIDIGGNC